MLRFLSMDALTERDWFIARRFAAYGALALLAAILVWGSSPTRHG